MCVVRGEYTDTTTVKAEPPAKLYNHTVDSLRAMKGGVTYSFAISSEFSATPVHRVH